MSIEDVNGGDAGEGDENINDTENNGVGGEGGGEGGDGGKGPNGWIPKQRLDEVLGDVRQLRSELQAEREARIRLEEQGKPAAPQKYTRAQLRELVATGQMTQEQADDTWDEQRERQITERVQQTVTEVVTTSRVTDTVASDLGRYKAAVPNIMIEGSEERQRVVNEFNFLVGLNGQPKTPKERLAMELAATRAALGPIERVERGKGRTVHEPNPEAGGGRPGSGGGGSGKKTLLDQAPERYRQHYQRMLDNGQITPEQVEKELKRVGIGKLTERAKRYG